MNSEFELCRRLEMNHLFLESFRQLSTSQRVAAPTPAAWLDMAANADAENPIPL